MLHRTVIGTREVEKISWKDVHVMRNNRVRVDADFKASELREDLSESGEEGREGFVMKDNVNVPGISTSEKSSTPTVVREGGCLIDRGTRSRDSPAGRSRRNSSNSNNSSGGSARRRDESTEETAVTLSRRESKIQRDLPVPEHRLVVAFRLYRQVGIQRGR